MNDEQEILYEVSDNGVAQITLNRPAKLNAATPQMSKTLINLVRQVDEDHNIRVLIFTGTGRSFSVGSDIAELNSYASHWDFRNRRDYCDAIRSLRKPIIAVINGYAYGGGLELALSADVRLAAESATFCAAEIKLGWTGGGGVSALLTANVAATDAALILLTGDPIASQEALRMGIVSRVIPDDKVLAEGRQLAATIASRPPIATQTAKANLRASLSMGLEPAIQYERELQTICMATADAAEGRAAFTEKRPGRFVGR